VRPPLAPGTPIDAERIRGWLARFAAYRDAVVPPTIEGWLNQFEDRDRDLAARVLDVVEFFGLAQIYAAFRQTLAALDGWDRDPARRVGNWRFAAMSGSAGESGDAMLHHFRVANGLDREPFNQLFVDRSTLFRQTMLHEDDPNRLSDRDVVVLVDDFSGTGEQVCTAWNEPQTSFSSFLQGVGRTYLLLIAASSDARERIRKETSLSPIPAHELGSPDNIFSDRCAHFTERDRLRLLHYGEIADRRNPKGRGECGLVVVFQHRSPNNSIPILHAVHRRWTGLFPRHN
jgi:hypothetical protein